MTKSTHTTTKRPKARAPSDPKTRCDDCGAVVPLSKLAKSLFEVDSLADKLDPGGEVPAGECECGALAYLVR